MKMILIQLYSDTKSKKNKYNLTRKHSYKHNNVMFHITVIVHSTIAGLATQNQEGCFLGHQAPSSPIRGNVGCCLHLINKSSF